jgi:uncharacterized repeat protein (TIGR01451 family)
MSAVSIRSRRSLQVTLLVALALVGAPSAHADTCTWKLLSLLGGPWSTNFNCSGPNGSAYPGQKGADTASIGLLQLLGNVRVDVNVPFKVALTFDPLLPVGLDIPAGGALILNAGSSSNSTANQININGGTLSVASGATISNYKAGINLNSGAFNVPGNLSLNTGYSQSGGTMTLVSPGNFGATSMAISGGTVTGNGTLTGNVTNSGGSFNPGAPVGSINVTGNYTQNSTGIINIDLNGTVAGTQYDQLRVSGAANLGGTLKATLGYAPSDGDVFDAVTFGSRSADFTTYNMPPISGPPPGTIQHNFVGSAVRLQAVIPQADLVVSETASPASILHNQTGTFTVTVRNNGPSVVTGVAVTNALSIGSFASYTATTATCTGNGASCTIASLGSGASETITLTANGTAVGTMTNVASASAASVPDPNLTNNSATANVVVNASADLSAAISGPPNVNAGSNATFTLTVTNGGPDATVPTVGLTIAGGTLVSSSGAGFTCGTPASCTGSSLGNGSTATLTVVAQAQSQGGSLVLGANIGPLAGDPNSSNNSASRTTTINALADLKITKSATAPLVAAQSANYTITVKNLGPSDADGVSVTDPTPAGLAFTGNSGACSSAFPCNLGTLAAGATATITSAYVVNANATSVSNVATVSATTPDPIAANNSATTLDSVTPNADLAVTVTALPGSILNGQTATFTIRVTNNGPSAASAISVNNAISGGTFLSASGITATCTGANCTIPVLVSGQNEIITLILKANAVGAMSNTTTVSTTAATDPNSANNSASANVTANGSADLSASVTGPANANAGSSVTYTVTIGNLGPDPANPTVNLSLTGGTLVSATGAGFFCGTPAFCVGTALNSGSSRTITVVAQSSAQAGTMVLSASVGPAVSDTNLVNNVSSATTTVAAIADLQITKIPPPVLMAGSVVTYTISVKNAGPSDAAGVSVNDTTPIGMTFVSNSGACATPFPCSLGDVVAGSVSTITATYSLSPGAAGAVANIASVSGSTPDPNPTNNSATSTGTVIQKADLSVSNSGPTFANSGTNITYAISVTNNGPSDASNVQLDDPTPLRLTFVSANGACTSLPCSLGSMTPGQTRSVQATYTVTAGPTTTITNTATVSSSTTDLDFTNNSSSIYTATGCATSAPGSLSPANNATNVSVNGTLSWSDVNAGSYKVYLGPEGSGCSTVIANVGALSIQYGGLSASTTYEWRVEATSTSCPTFSTSCVKFTTAASSTTCPTTPPTLIAPMNVNAGSQATFQWSAVSGATQYDLFVNDAKVATTSGTTFGPLSVPTTMVRWYVVAQLGPSCAPLASHKASFNGCDTTAVPIPSLVGEVASGQGYDFFWTAPAAATRFEVDESTDIFFDPSLTTTQVTTASTLHFQHSVTSPTGFYYRVRAFLGCATAFTANSFVMRVVVAPRVSPTNPNLSVPAGSKTLVSIPVHAPGLPGQVLPFTASLDNKPWLKSVQPTSGVLPPEGFDFVVVADPNGLPNGTFTGTLLLLLTTPGNGKIGNNGVTPVGVPVSISLVTPVTPRPAGNPPANALIIPSVGHLDGINSHWQSDIRVANTSQQTTRYQLTFTPDDAAKGVKQTLISVDPGVTTALDDIIKTWYGVGSLGESANGVLEIRPLDNPAKGGPANDDVNVSFSTVASSRTYNIASNSVAGTLGQFIPAIPFGNFVGRAVDASHAATVLGLQQVAQNAAYRTNVGVVEASGQPVSVLISAFDASGNKLLDFPLDLKGGEQRQLNSFLAQNKISLSDGRLEVKVTSGDGKVTAYASVVDNKSGDPLFISGEPLGQNTFDHFVLPGVADLNTGFAAWRTDMRIFNPTNTPQFVTLNFYPQNSSDSAQQMAAMTINPGEVRKLDNTMGSVFGLSNTGGAVHVTTGGPTPLVVTGRTYNFTSNGTFGQFIPAMTSADAVGKGERGLSILQAEDSVRYRTNLGIAEVTGKPATVEVQIILPDSKITPSTQIPIPANGFLQMPVIQSLGLTNVYNARITLRVVDGDGKISAYGSVIDQITQDPTYVPAQK